MRLGVVIVLGIAIGVGSVFSQAPAGAKPAFEVASIKPGAPGMRESVTNQPGRFVANNVSLRMMIGFAYSLRDFEISGGPAWITSDRWTIEAKAAEGPVGVALQSLLEDRFALKTHRERRESLIYALVINKDGARLKAVDPPPQTTPGQPQLRLGPGGVLPADFMPQPGAIMAGPGLILASAVTMGQLVTVLNRGVDRPIVDKTGLKGYFNIRLQFAPESTPGVAVSAAPATASDPLGASIFTAIQEQLGLKLAPDKDSVDVLVIDSVQRPSDN